MGTFVCDTCGELFDAYAWHCPGCDHHWPMHRWDCWNCRQYERPRVMPLDLIQVDKRHRPINSQKVIGLAESIGEIGLLNPVTITPDGRLVAGWHRVEACKKLGWQDIPVNVIFDRNELEIELAEIDENLIRNELTELEESIQLARRKEIYERLHPETRHGGTPGNQYSGQKRENDTVSFSQDTAAKTGKSRRTIERKAQIGKTLAPVADKLLETPIADNQKELLALARMDEEERREVVEKIAAGEARNTKEARRAIKREIQESVPADLPPADHRYRLIHADMTTAEIEPGSIDAIITDPPYPREYLPLYEALARMAAQALKPGGSLLVMVGQSYLPDVLALMTPHIRYHWTLAYLTPGGQAPQIWPRKVNTFWKPILWFVNGEYDGDWIGDVARSAVNDNDKRFHNWGQSESGMADLIERFTYPGDLILDPFLGGGTTGAVALAMNRRFIGVDVNESALRTAAARIAAALEIAT